MTSILSYLYTIHINQNRHAERYKTRFARHGFIFCAFCGAEALKEANIWVLDLLNRQHLHEGDIRPTSNTALYTMAV
ncbi:MAG: hypothetical protein JZU65_10965 [Chlorobium sp.]|nr:hypothetical protein [Chlorobium sp.]